MGQSQSSPSPSPSPSPPPPSKLLSQPWVPDNPFGENFSSFRESVIAPKMYGGKRKYNILVVGQVGAGKSSFVNSLLSVTDEDDSVVKNVSECRGQVAHSTTFELRKFPLCDKIDIFDMPGYDQEATDIEITMELFLRIFDGKVRDRSDLRAESGQSEDPERKIDAVILVFDATKMASQSTATMVMPIYRELVEACIHRHIRYTVVLAKVDALCEEAGEDIETVFHSKEIAKVAGIVHEKLGLNKIFIIPVKNYVDERTRRGEMDKLLLHSLHTTVRLAEDNARYN